MNIRLPETAPAVPATFIVSPVIRVIGLLGCFVVLRGLAFIGDALAHAVFPGVVLSYLAGRSILIGAFVFGSLTALGVGVLSRSRRVSATGPASTRGTCVTTASHRARSSAARVSQRAAARWSPSRRDASLACAAASLANRFMPAAANASAAAASASPDPSTSACA